MLYRVAEDKKEIGWYIKKASYNDHHQKAEFFGDKCTVIGFVELFVNRMSALKALLPKTSSSIFVTNSLTFGALIRGTLD